YPNPLSADPEEARVAVDHLQQVILAAERLGLDRVNTFVGRDPAKSVDDNWPRFMEVWRPLVAFAEERGVRIGIENCPMLFTGEVDWSAFFAALTDAGYDGPVCIEVEDRAYEGSLEARKRSLVQSKRFLESYTA